MSDRHTTTVSAAVIARTKAHRAALDGTIGNAFPVEERDRRWIGDLGEIVFARWLEVHGFEFVPGGGPDGTPDFTVAGTTIDLKTVERGRRACVAERHLNGHDLLAFADYDATSRVWRLLGALAPVAFIARADRRPAKGDGGRPYYLLAPEHLWPPEVLRGMLEHAAGMSNAPAVAGAR